RREEVEAGNLEVARAAQPTVWAVWRPEFVSNFRSLDADEAAMLANLVAGKPFPDLCEAIAAFTGEAEAPARAAGLLRAMVGGGMVGAGGGGGRGGGLRFWRRGAGPSGGGSWATK